MNRHSLLRASLVFSALLLSACGTPSWDNPEAGLSIAQRFPISVEPSMRTLRVPFGGYGVGTDPNTGAQLDAFVHDYMDRGVGAISVSTPAGWDAAAVDFADELIIRGVPRERVIVGTDPMPVAGAEILIGYVRYIARAPECGDWSTNLAKTASNAPSPNFGCATQANIAAMVADPRDLVAPAPSTPEYVARRMTVLGNYSEGTPTPAQRAPEQNLSVSQVGAN